MEGGEECTGRGEACEGAVTEAMRDSIQAPKKDERRVE
jgi:hypothetical protein